MCLIGIAQLMSFSIFYWSMIVLGRLVLENRTTLTTGESVSGLLVYRTFKPRTRNFQIDVTLNYGDGNAIRTFAPYKRRK